MASAILPQLPPALEDLADLALDLFWTWSHAGDALWSRLDPDLWDATRNPWTMLQAISPKRLRSLARDADFRNEVQALMDERHAYYGQPGWFGTNPANRALSGIAFFSLEFGLSEALPLYAGGLGILAGDMLKTASDLGVPVIGVGLLYQEGYFRQLLDATGQQEEAYPYNEPASLPVQPARDEDGGWLCVSIDLPGRTVLLRIWTAVVGRTRLYLLDSNHPMNNASDRGITAKLYGGSHTIRFLQEVALGVGGWRALAALGLAPEVCHINEGNAAFATLERASAAMQEDGLSFPEAVWATRAGNIFTTHTPVEAGFSRFDPALIDQHFLGEGGLYSHLGLSARELLALGRQNPEDDSEPFTMTYMALRLSAHSNAVSRLHEQVSQGLFAGLYPRWPVAEVPVGHVTNGVHMPSWDSAAADELWTETCGKERWRSAPDSNCANICSASDESLWAMRARQRAELVNQVRGEQRHHLRLRNPRSGALPDVERILDPNALTLGFGRRFTAYKRPGLLLTDPERLRRLLTDPTTPVQLVIAGKAHPEDEDGKRFVARWAEFVSSAGMERHAVFLEDYDMTLAEMLVQGVDVWINTPRRPYEACGTSGMKVLVNGGINLSSRDGWWDEAFEPDVGWAFGDHRGDLQEAGELYRLLEQEVVPEFYTRDADGLPRRWIARMRASMSQLAGRFASNRMLADYLDGYYLPAASEISRRQEDDYALARELAGTEQQLRAHWDQMHFGRVDVTRNDATWHFVIQVQLGEVPPDRICVELAAEALDSDPAQRLLLERGAALPGAMGGYEYHGDVKSRRPAEHFTPRIVPALNGGITRAELPFIRWQH